MRVFARDGTAGLFNGPSNATAPSHRAYIPDVHNVYLLLGPEDSSVGVALDMAQGVVYNRSSLNSPGACVGTVQLAWYAHRALRSVMVLSVQWIDAASAPPPATCTVALQRYTVDGNASLDANLTDVSNSFPLDGATVWSGVTLVPEVGGLVVAQLAGPHTFPGLECVAAHVPTPLPTSCAGIPVATGRELLGGDPLCRCV